MMIDWLRGIFRSSDDARRIAFLIERLNDLEYAQEQQMARMDEMIGLLAEVGNLTDAVVTRVHELETAVANGAAEDPRVGEAADALASIKGRLLLVMPAAG